MSRLNALLVGLGSMGKNHARVLSEFGHKVTTVDPVNLEANFRKLADIPTKLDSFDFGIVSCSTEKHVQVALDLLEAGFPILIEKPIGASLPEVEFLASEATRNKVPIFVGYVERYNPVIDLLRGLVEEFGASSFSSFTFQRVGGPRDHRAPSSVVLDLLVHDLDLAGFVFGRSLALTSSSSTGFGFFEELWNLEAIGELAPNLHAKFIVSKESATKARTISFALEGRSVQLNLIDQTITYHPELQSSNLVGLEVENVSDNVRFARLAKKEPLRGQLADFTSVVTHSDSNKLVLGTIEDALYIHHVLSKFAMSR